MSLTALKLSEFTISDTITDNSFFSFINFGDHTNYIVGLSTISNHFDIPALQGTTTTVGANSANWNYQGTDVKVLTGNWQSAYTSFNSQSANNSSVFGNVNSLSANWNSNYSQYNSNSALFFDTRTTVNSHSGLWGTGGTFDGTVVISNSANWNSVYSAYNSNSASFVSNFTTVQSHSAAWGTGGGGSVVDINGTTNQVSISSNAGIYNVSLPNAISVSALSASTLFLKDSKLTFNSPTNAFSMLKGSGATVDVRLGDDSDYGTIRAKNCAFGLGGLYTTNGLIGIIPQFGEVDLGDTAGQHNSTYIQILDNAQQISLQCATGITIGTYTIPTTDGSLNNTLITDGAGHVSWGAVSLSTTTGTLAANKGGTGNSIFSQGDMLYATSSSAITRLAKNTTATRYLANTGTNNNPAWDQIALTTGVTGILPTANGGTGINNTSNSVQGWLSNPSVGSLGTSCGVPISDYSSRSVSSATGTILSTDSIILVDSSGQSVVLTLPSATGLAGRSFLIIDKTGSASTNAISIKTSSSSVLINGNDGSGIPAVIDESYGSVWLITDGSNWVTLPTHSRIVNTDTITVDRQGTGTDGTVITVNTQDSITSDSSGIKLQGDSASPGNSKLYGTNASGTKGWYDQPVVIQSTASGSTWALTFQDSDQEIDCTTSASTTITSSGYATGRRIRLFIIPDTVDRALSLPAWTWLEGTPTQVTANKHMQIDLYCRSTTAGSVYATYASET
jgi:hypothetical protein